MSISYELVNHTLNHIFQGNKNEFARELGIHPSNLRNTITRMEHGGASPSLVNKTLELLDRNPDALNTFLMQRTQRDSTPSSGTCQHSGIMEQARATLSAYAKSAAHRARMRQFSDKVEELMEEVQAAYCGNNPERFVACKAFSTTTADDMQNVDLSNTPCESFRKFVENIRQSEICPYSLRK